MGQRTSFSYGDEVLIISGEYCGRIGAIVGMNHPEAASLYTVEFGDGSDAEIPVECLEIHLEADSPFQDETAIEEVRCNASMDSSDKDLFQRLRRELEHEIATYVYEHPENAIGTPLSADHVRTLLNSIRESLVEPHWEEVNICNTWQEALTAIGVMRRCIVMAEEDGYVLVFDPVGHNYHLASRGIHGLGTWGICGDGVDCFMAR